MRFDAPVVFAGYGIDGADERWNDFGGVDVKGKLLIVMVNDPRPTAAEPNRFGGKSPPLTWMSFRSPERRNLARALKSPFA